jgi:general secretion pathway protein J
MTRAPARRAAGFTLIEVTIALAILAFMMVVAWSTTSASSRAKREFEAIEQRNHEIRVAMARMVRDLSSAYLSANENQGLQERRTQFVGDSHGSVDSLRFSSLGHAPMWAESNESEQTLIAYFAEDDRKDGSKTNLVRRESRWLSNEPWEREPGDVDVLLRDVAEVEFQYFWFDAEKSHGEWKEEWDSTQETDRGRLPTRVRISVTVEVEEGKPVTYVTQARIMMQEELRFFTN